MSHYKNYDEFKQGVKDNYPIRKVINLSEIKIDLDDNTSNFGIIDLEGHNLKLSRKAFQGLIKTLGLSNNFINKFANIFGAKAKSQLVNIIKGKLATNRDQKVAIYVHPQTFSIVAVSDTNKPFVSPNVYYDMVEGVISDHKLDVSNMTITPEGDLKISTLNTGSGWGIEIPELKDESFHCGVIVTAGPTEDIAIDPHILRLVCTNGMVGPRRLEMGPRLESNNVSDIQKFMLESKRLAESHKQFKTIFVDQVKRMNSIQASYEEMFKMRESVKKHVADITDTRTEAVLDKYFPLMDVRKEYFDNKNIALGNLTHRHWKNAKTHMTTWDLLNSLTDVASHDYGMGISDYKKEILKKEAGMYMFKKEFDTEFIL
jgi:hypothetical protein